MDDASAPDGYEYFEFNEMPAWCRDCNDLANLAQCPYSSHTIVHLPDLGYGPSATGESSNSRMTGLWDSSGRTGDSNAFTDPSTQSTEFFLNQQSESHDHAIIDGREMDVLGSHEQPSRPHAFLNDCADEPGRQATVDPYSSHSDVMMEDLRPATEALLQHLSRRCQAEMRLPWPREVRGLAEMEGITIRAVEAWFASRLSEHGSSMPLAEPASAPQPPLHDSERPPSNRGTDTQVLSQVMQYARQSFSKRCLTTQSRKSTDSGGRYVCTTGCGYTTANRDSWQRHEQKWQPQEFWHCVLCRRSGRQPVICSRKNHVFQHFGNCHGNMSHREKQRLRNESKVDYDAGYEKTCKFWNGEGTCQYRFESWNDRVEHYLAHFNDGIDDGPWRLEYRRNRWFDGDDDDSGNDNSHNGSTGTRASRFSSTLDTHTSFGSSGNSQQRDVGARYKFTPDINISLSRALEPLALNRSTTRHSSRILPERLIHVATLSWSNATPESKYVALDGSPAWGPDCLDWMIIIDNLDETSGLWELSRTCAPFKKALSIVSNMGYPYLWIDGICESSAANVQYLQALYEQAVLTVVLVKPRAATNEILYYTCPYNNIEQVRTWAVQNLPILHVQNLGHGAFGIVDEVRLGTASDLYARKCLLRRNARDVLKTAQFREIEIMQKMQHQNIAQFIAAYADSRSLNILMRPVAECSLQDLLAEPSRFAEKLKHIPRWFYSLASAVSYMHGLSLRHKDIKPANVLVRGSDVYLSDFGATFDFFMDDSGSDGDALTTPKYCAPEVACRGHRGRKADVFSLGCVFLELNTVYYGRSLGDLGGFLEPGRGRRKPTTSYCKRLNRCQAWTDALLESPSSHHQHTCLVLCRQMLARDPISRPSASEAHDVLATAASLLSPSASTELRPRHALLGSSLQGSGVLSDSRSLGIDRVQRSSDTRRHFESSLTSLRLAAGAFKLEIVTQFMKMRADVRQESLHFSVASFMWQTTEAHEVVFMDVSARAYILAKEHTFTHEEVATTKSILTDMDPDLDPATAKIARWNSIVSNGALESLPSRSLLYSDTKACFRAHQAGSRRWFQWCSVLLDYAPTSGRARLQLQIEAGGAERAYTITMPTLQLVKIFQGLDHSTALKVPSGIPDGSHKVDRQIDLDESTKVNDRSSTELQARISDRGVSGTDDAAYSLLGVLAILHVGTQFASPSTESCKARKPSCSLDGRADALKPDEGENPIELGASLGLQCFGGGSSFTLV